MPRDAWEADKMLDSYIYDYLLKRNLQNTAKAFRTEAHVSSDPVSIDAPGGFLLEWWSVFWDIFIARTNDKHSDVAASYLESIKAREQQQSSQQQIQMQQLLLQKRAQQHQRNVQHLHHHHHHQQEHLQQHRRQQKHQHHDDKGQFSTSDQDILLAADSSVRQNSAAANSMPAKIYEERMKVPAQTDALDEVAMKQMFTESNGQLLDSNLTSILKSASVSDQASGQIFHGSVSGISGSLQHAQARDQRLQESTQDIKAETNAALNLRTVGADESLTGVGVLGSNQAGNNLTLKGWPLTGLEHLRSGFLQHKSLTQSPQPLHHLQFLTPQQQQLLLQAQQSMSSSPVDMDSRRLRMLYGSRNLVPGRDVQSNPFTEIIPTGGPSLQNIGSTMQRMESDMLIKKIAALQHQQTSNQQQLLHHPLLSPQPQNSNHHTDQQEKMVAGTVAMHGSLCNSFHGNEQVFKNQSGRKRKQPITPSGPIDSSGTANTAGPSPSSSPSTPSAHSPGDTVSTPSLHHNANLSKALVVYGADAPGSIGSPTSQLVQFVDERNDNVFLPHDEVDAINAGSHCIDSDKGSILQEISSARASTSRVLSCHFSFDGKLLATGGHDKKVVLWNAETLKQKSTLEEHTSLISDVRFSPSIPRLATSSFDKTVRVWDADKQDYSVCTFTGHLASVMSLDFHPVKDDLICSCDGNNEMRFWSINEDRAVRVAQGGSTQLRFQPRLGGYLAAASDNVVSILDVETQACIRRFEGHAQRVDSLCWDPSGEYVVSVSEDTVKVWSVKMGNDERFVNELKCTGSKFSSCTFHPTYPSLLIIGCHQSLELWDMSENRTMTIPAHDGPITSLATSSSGMVASTGHDKYVKLWGSLLPRSNR